MKANNLTISIPYKGCNKNCPYCISKMTGLMKADYRTYIRNIPKVKEMAKHSDINSVLITSKGEPLLNIEMLELVASEFNHFPLELQTNGILLDERVINKLDMIRFNVIAISIDNPGELERIMQPIKSIDSTGMIVRLAILLNSSWPSGGRTLELMMDYSLAHNVRQLTFRIPSIPQKRVNTAESLKAVEWIEAQQFSIDVMHAGMQKVRDLRFGATVYDMEGIAVTIMQYCIQEDSGDDDIRSLIYQEDGHLYTSWDKKGSILF